MSLPTSYTDSTLIAFMTAELAATGQVAGLTQPDYASAVEDVAEAMGSEIAAVPAERMIVLRAIARREAWRLVMRQTAGDYKFSSGGTSGGAASYERQQVHAQAKALYEAAAQAAQAALAAEAENQHTAPRRRSSAVVPIEVRF